MELRRMCKQNYAFAFMNQTSIVSMNDLRHLENNRKLDNSLDISS